jgi:hypothetical protein
MRMRPSAAWFRRGLRPKLTLAEKTAARACCNCPDFNDAEVAELADAQDLGSCGREAVGVQLPPSAIP